MAAATVRSDWLLGSACASLGKMPRHRVDGQEDTIRHKSDSNVDDRKHKNRPVISLLKSEMLPTWNQLQGSQNTPYNDADVASWSAPRHNPMLRTFTCGVTTRLSGEAELALPLRVQRNCNLSDLAQSKVCADLTHRRTPVRWCQHRRVLRR